MAIVALGTLNLEFNIGWVASSSFSLAAGNRYLLRFLTQSSDPQRVYSYALMRIVVSLPNGIRFPMIDQKRIFFDPLRQFTFYEYSASFGNNLTAQVELQRISLYNRPPTVSNLSVEIDYDFESI